jgi:hypothetical protein
VHSDNSSREVAGLASKTQVFDITHWHFFAISSLLIASVFSAMSIRNHLELNDRRFGAK